MAVFTPVTLEEIAPRIAADFVIGDATSLEGIHGGIENSNFFLNCQHDGQVHEYVLTIFERLSFTQLPYYLELMLHLANQGIPVPKPMANRRGALVIELKGKPASIVTKLPGQAKLAPQPEHCEQVGRMLAKMHLAGQSFSLSQPNLRSLPWWQETIPLILPHMTGSQKESCCQRCTIKRVFLPRVCINPYLRAPAIAIYFVTMCSLQIIKVNKGLAASLISTLLAMTSGYLI